MPSKNRRYDSRVSLTDTDSLYCLMTPFCVSGGGGAQLNTKVIELTAVTVRFCGGALGTVRQK